MIEFKKGNFLDEQVEALVNPVNCVGVMGRGLALQVKKAFPENFTAYAVACKNEQLKPGNLFIFESGLTNNPIYIINFPTKNHWREKSKIEYIEDGLEHLIEIIKEKEIKSIAIPPLGCGLGGLEWFEIKPRIVTAFKALPEVKVSIFEPITKEVSN